MLDLKDICKSLNDVRVPNEVNLHLGRELVHMLKGGNGLEKTTLNNILAQETEMFVCPTNNSGKNEIVAQTKELLAVMRQQ